jgi:hypothetical protein
MPVVSLDKKGFNELRAAVKRNPARVREEVGKYFVRGLAVYTGIINNNPWKTGMTGGGAPTDTGNLRDTHQKEIQAWQASIYPTAPYASYVHGIDGLPRQRKYPLRPWLDYAQEKGDKDLQRLEGEMLDAITNDLAS